MIDVFKNFYDEQQYISGSGLRQFEIEYANYNGVQHAVGVGNGHDALVIVLKSLGIGKGDEVIIPAHTFIATALSIINAGATPVLADIDETTYTINPESVESKITDRTKAIIPVHIYGNPCDMDQLPTISQENDLYLIEDNAQAQGAEYKKSKTGSFGIMNFSSFYPTKNLGALGDGGMITTNTEMLAEKAISIRNYGKSGKGTFDEIGLNSRLDELQARMLSVKLKYLDKWNNERIIISGWYERELREVKEIQLQSVKVHSKNVRHIFPVLVKSRNELKLYLKAKGIDTLIHYEKPVHLHNSFSFLKHKKDDFPVAEKICEEELSLPIYPGLKYENIKYICNSIKSFLQVKMAAGH